MHRDTPDEKSGSCTPNAIPMCPKDRDYMAPWRKNKKRHIKTHMEFNYPESPCSSRRQPKEPKREGLPPNALNSVGGTISRSIKKLVRYE